LGSAKGGTPVASSWNHTSHFYPLARRALLPGTRALDLGCGEGLLSRELRNAGAVHVLGVDLSPRDGAVRARALRRGRGSRVPRRRLPDDAGDGALRARDLLRDAAPRRPRGGPRATQGLHRPGRAARRRRPGEDLRPRRPRTLPRELPPRPPREGAPGLLG